MTQGKLGTIFLVLPEDDQAKSLQAELQTHFHLHIWAGEQLGGLLPVSERPDCVVSDSRIGAQSMLSFIRELRQSPGNRNLGWILLIGRGSEQDMHVEYEGEVDLFLTRPPLIEELSSALTALVRSSRR